MAANDEKVDVLLLDDERLVRLTIGTWLKATHFRVTALGSPVEAMEAVRHTKFQAIITDVMMEGVDGFMFRDFVRTVDKEVPVIFLTSLVNDSDNTFMRKVMGDYNSYYVPKDSPREYLVGKLEQVVRAYRAETGVGRLQEGLERSMRLAQLVQNSMLPTWAHVGKEYFYGSLWKPCSQVSGDLFQWFPISDDACLFVFGDISGHGVAAALAMTAMQAYLQRASSLSDAEARDVRALAQNIDRFLTANLKDVAYMAGTVVYFNAKERRLRYLNAGGVDLMCYSRGKGERFELNPDKRGCPPLGLIPDAVFRPEDVVDVIIPEDAIVLSVSDGILDLTADEAGEERIPSDLAEEVSAELAHDRAGGACVFPHRLLSTMEKLGYVHAQDDIQVVAFGPNLRHCDACGMEVAMNPAAIDEAAVKVGDFVRRSLPDDDELSVKAELLVGEHLMNVHDHALDDYQRRHERSILRASVEGDYLVLASWDRGRAWDGPEDIRARSDAKLETQNDDMANHGRGEAIVRKLSVRLSRQRIFDLNRNVFYIPLKGGMSSEERGVEA